MTLIVRSKTFRISTIARARDKGSNGDSITVENLGSKQLVLATVIGNRTVEVTPETER